MFRKILIILVILIAALLVVVALQPPTFRVERSATIPAPAAAVFPHVNDFHNWQAWSPWAKLDPTAKNTFEGPPAGTGAIFAWAGNQEIGEGRMTITESHPNEWIRFKLDFIKPFPATNTTEFTFKEEGGQTLVTWSMSGNKNFFFKAMGLFMSCDKMVGGDFEKGLANLKSIVEKSSQPSAVN